jgi:hypothetical protein
MAIKINGSMTDSFGAVMTDFSFDKVVDGKFETSVTGEQEVTRMVGVSVSLPPKEPDIQRDKVLRESILDPKVHIKKGTVVYADAKSPYGVEIVVDGQPRPVQLKDGLPFVDIKRGEIYEIRVYNDSPLEAACSLTIDGMSVFSFSEIREASGPKQGQPRYTQYVLQPGASPVISGWHRTNERVDSFLVTEYAKSAAGMLKTTAGCGTITANFAAAWEDGAPVPADEPPTKRGPGDATGFGPPKKTELKEVKRRFGVLRASVSVRYSKPAEETVIQPKQ